jgi:MFS transporter, CP family, cyanate transporter
LSSAPASRAARSSRLALVGVLVVAANLRIGVVQVGPVIEEIRADTGMSSALAGALTTIPFLCSGAFAFAGGASVRRLGAPATLRVCLVLIGVGTLLRAAAPGALLLLLATLPIGVGLALAGVALATVTGERFPERGGQVTGAYIASMSAAAAVVGLLTVPLADLLGGWRWSLAVAALPAFAALVLWRERSDPSAASRSAALRPPRRVALVLALVFGFQSVCFTTMIGWIAAIYEDAGWSRGAAGLATASIPVLTVVSSLLVGALTRPSNRRRLLLAAALTTGASLVAIALAPVAVAPLWLLLLGLGTGATFPLAMTLPLDLGEDPANVAALTAWMLGIGYLIAGAGPVFAGALRDATGGFAVPVLVIAGFGALAGVLAMSPVLTAYARPRGG